jgi:hypothetical protein
MDRRGFLIETARAGSVLLILPAGWALGGCGSGPSSTGGAGPGTTGSPTATANTLRFTSDVAGTHSHDFTIAMADLAQPSADGLTGPTTISLGHHHLIALSQGELTQIQAGGTLNKATSIVDGHLHNFKFSLATAATTGSTPTTDAGTTPGTTGSGPGTAPGPGTP